VNTPGAAFQSRDFRLFQAARFATMCGLEMLNVGVGWQVYAITGRALDLGFVGLAQFLPVFGLTLVGGHVADRFDRRRILIACNVTITSAALLLYFISRRGVPQVAPIYAVLTVLGVARAFSGPAGQALMPHLVPLTQIGNAVAWGSTVFKIANVVGPTAGGLIYAWRGASAVYGAAAGALLGATASLLSMRIRLGRMEQAGLSWATVLAGVRYVWQQPIILGSISLDLFAVLLGGADALLPIFARDILHVGPWGLGLLRAAPSLGAAATAIWLAWHPIGRRAGSIMLTSVAIFGVATVVFGRSENFALTMAALAVIGASDMVSVFVRMTLVPLFTPPEMRGRVSAVNMVFIGASNEFGEFESGLTAQWFGAARAAVLGGLGTLLVVGAWIGLFPSLRGLDRLEAPAAREVGNPPAA
jgi:MFS family permease